MLLVLQASDLSMKIPSSAAWVLIATLLTPACSTSVSPAASSTAPATLAKTCLELNFADDTVASAPMLIQFPTYTGSFAALPETQAAATSLYDAPMPLNIAYTPTTQGRAIISLQNYNTEATLTLYFTTPHSGQAQLSWKKQGAAPFTASAMFRLKDSPAERVRLVLPAFSAGM